MAKTEASLSVTPVAPCLKSARVVVLMIARDLYISFLLQEINKNTPIKAIKVGTIIFCIVNRLLNPLKRSAIFSE